MYPIEEATGALSWAPAETTNESCATKQRFADCSNNNERLQTNPLLPCPINTSRYVDMKWALCEACHLEKYENYQDGIGFIAQNCFVIPKFFHCETEATAEDSS